MLYPGGSQSPSGALIRALSPTNSRDALGTGGSVGVGVSVGVNVAVGVAVAVGVGVHG